MTEWDDVVSRIQHEREFRRRIAHDPATVLDTRAFSAPVRARLMQYARELMAYHGERLDSATLDRGRLADQQRQHLRGEHDLGPPLPADMVGGGVSGRFDVGPGVTGVTVTGASATNPIRNVPPRTIPIPMPGGDAGGGLAAFLPHDQPGVQRYPTVDEAIARSRQQPFDPAAVGDPLHPAAEHHSGAQAVDQQHLVDAQHQLESALSDLQATEQPDDIVTRIRQLLVAAHLVVRDPAAAQPGGTSHVEWNRELADAYHAWEHVHGSSAAPERFTAARDEVVRAADPLRHTVGGWVGRHDAGPRTRWHDGDHQLTELGQAVSHVVEHLVR